MIGVLHNIFICALYLFGIGFIGFITVALWVAVIKYIREHQND